MLLFFDSWREVKEMFFIFWIFANSFLFIDTIISVLLILISITAQEMEDKLREDVSENIDIILSNFG
jgi:hypothetical protein